MNVSKAVVVILCALLLGGVTLGLYGQGGDESPTGAPPRAVRPRSRGQVLPQAPVQPPPDQPLPAPPPPVQRPLELAQGKSQPTRVQIDVFELTCPNDQLARLDLGRITDKDPACGQILERLRELGSARLLARVDDVVDLANGASVTTGKRTPVVQEMTVSPSGVVTPNVAYEKVGFIGKFRGEWSEPEPAYLNLMASIEISNVVKSRVQVAEKVNLPEFTACSIKKQIRLRNGEAAFTVSNNLPDPFDDQGQVTVSLVRLRGTRVDKQP